MKNLMKNIGKVLLALLAIIALEIITQPLWRYQVWMVSGVTWRYDRYSRIVERWDAKSAQWIIGYVDQPSQ